MNKNYTLKKKLFVKIQGGYTPLISLRGGVMDCHPHPPLKPPMPYNVKRSEVNLIQFRYLHLAK